MRLGGPARTLTAAVPISILVLFALNLGLGLMHFVGPPVPEWAARGEDRGYLWDLTRERTVASWYTSMQLALIGALLIGFAGTRPGGRAAVITVGLAGLLFLFLSLDELISLHEKFGRFLEEIGPERADAALGETGAWMLVVAPAFIAALAVGAWFGWSLLRGRRKAQVLFFAGVVVHVGSFAGLELLENWAPARERQIAVVERSAR